MTMTSSLANTLRQLSDALDALAESIEKQKQSDTDIQSRQLSVIVQRFSGEVNQLKENRNQSPDTKRRKGYIRDFLAQKGIQVISSTDSLQAKNYLVAAANYLVDHYGHLREFYARLKAKQVEKRDFTHQSGSKSSMSYIRAWCKMLHDQKLIDAFADRGSQAVFVDISNMAEATNYVNGTWLELFLRGQIASALTQSNSRIHSFDLLAQAFVSLKNGRKAELDLLLMLNDRLFWFECKSGRIGGDNFKKFADYRHILGLPTDQSVLVVTETNPASENNALSMAGMTCIGADRLETELTELLFPT